MIKLKDIILEAESFSAINKSTGKVSVFKTKDARDSAIKGGTHDKKAEKGGDSSAGKKDTPKVNIFDKPKKKDEPKSEPKSQSMDDLLDKYDSSFSSCLLYTSDAADDTPCVDLGGRRII